MPGTAHYQHSGGETPIPAAGTKAQRFAWKHAFARSSRNNGPRRSHSNLPLRNYGGTAAV